MEQIQETNLQVQAQKSFGERVKQYRKEKGLTMEQLGKMGGVSDVSYRKWERGENLPDGFNLYQLSKNTGVSVDWFLGLSDVKELSKAGNNHPTLETYWDMYSLLEWLRIFIDDARITIETETYQEMDYTSGYPEDRERKELHFCIPDERLVAWRESAEAIDTLSRKVTEASGKVDFDVWAMARAGLQAKMEKERLPYHRFSLDEKSDDLPF